MLGLNKKVLNFFIMQSNLLITTQRRWWDFVQPMLDAAALMASLGIIHWITARPIDDTSTAVGLIAVVTFMLASQLTGLHRRQDAGNANREMADVVAGMLRPAEFKRDELIAGPDDEAPRLDDEAKARMKELLKGKDISTTANLRTILTADSLRKYRTIKGTHHFTFTIKLCDTST